MNDCLVTVLRAKVNNPNLPIFNGVWVDIGGIQNKDYGFFRFTSITDPKVIPTIETDGLPLVNPDNVAYNNPQEISTLETMCRTQKACRVTIKGLSELKQFQLQTSSEAPFKNWSISDLSDFWCLTNLEKFAVECIDMPVDNITGDYRDENFIAIFKKCTNITIKSNSIAIDLTDWLNRIASQRTSYGACTIIVDGRNMTNRPKGLPSFWSSPLNKVVFTNDTATYPNGWYIVDSNNNPIS